MNNAFLRFPLVLLVSLFVVVAGCEKKGEVKPVNDIWDLDKQLPPKFINTNYIELDKIYRISRFRSGYGHDYSDFTEHCRSMKHYFEPLPSIDWTTVHIYAPITGKLTRVEQEWAGTKLEIESKDYPAFRISIFHINPASEWKEGEEVAEGVLLGTQAGSMTLSDIAVIVNDPTRQGRMVSYFSVITDEVFSLYQSLGIEDRDSLIISKETRDANPLTCSGDAFTTTDPLENWVYLKH